MEQVKEVPAIEREGKYEWADIFDGHLWKLTQGKDFECAASSFATNARSAAKRLGIKLEQCAVRGAEGEKGVVYIQAKAKS